MHVSLREVRDDDLTVFYRYSNEPDGIRMAAFTAEEPADRARFDAHWARLRHDPPILVLTVVGDGDVVGHVGMFGPPGEREVTYWIGQAYWGRGVATAALREPLGGAPERRSAPARPRTTAAPYGCSRSAASCRPAPSAGSRTRGGRRSTRSCSPLTADPLVRGDAVG